MKLYEIQVPMCTNNGTPYGATIDEFAHAIVKLVGGCSKRPSVHGMWENNGELYSEAMVPFHIACEKSEFQAIISLAFEVFPDQISIFTAEVGEATFQWEHQHRPTKSKDWRDGLTPSEKRLYDGIDVVA
jgi:hypothetical protein